MHGIELLLANCDRLTSLTDMNYFEGVTPEEIEKLKAQYIAIKACGPCYAKLVETWAVWAEHHRPYISTAWTINDV